MNCKDLFKILDTSLSLNYFCFIIIPTKFIKKYNLYLYHFQIKLTSLYMFIVYFIIYLLCSMSTYYS